MTRQRKSRGVVASRPLAPPTQPAAPGNAAGPAAGPGRPAPQPRPERAPVVVWVYRDGRVRVWAADRDQVRVHVQHVIDAGPRCEDLAEELAYLEMPHWARRVLDAGREVADGWAGWCKTVTQYFTARLDRAISDALSRLFPEHGGSGDDRKPS